MRGTIVALCIMCFVLSGSLSEAAAPLADKAAETAVVTANQALARECLEHARKGGDERQNAATGLVRDMERREIERLAVLVREELSDKAADAAAVPPRGDLRAARLLNFLDAKADTLAFDLATEGEFMKKGGKGSRWKFRTFGKKDLVVHMGEATVGLDDVKRHPMAYRRVFLRQLPDSDEYYVVFVHFLVKDRLSPPAPNPEGRYVPGLMDMHPPREFSSGL